MELDDLTVDPKGVQTAITVEGGFKIRIKATNLEQHRTGLHANSTSVLITLYPHGLILT